MEKHKSFHIKDEQLTRDGFKKFTKHETCGFDDCRFSRVCNHIHCIRQGMLKTAKQAEQNMSILFLFSEEAGDLLENSILFVKRERAAQKNLV